MDTDVALWIVVASALAFGFTNGFHDTATAIATPISTRALTPRAAVTLAAALNFAGAFLSLEVVATVATEIVDSGLVTPPAVFAGLVGAIAWNLATWYFGLPSSSSHALIGGVVGAAFAAEGADAIDGDGLVESFAIPALVAPVLAMLVAGAAVLVAYRIVGRRNPGVVRRAFRVGQLGSAGLLSLSHGANDAQKTMGVVFLGLIAAGEAGPGDDVPAWVIVSAAAALAAGTYAGGRRTVRTMRSRVIKLNPVQGVAAEGAGSAVILSASFAGFPLSTTHVTSGAIVGAGATQRLSAVRWGIAGNIFAAWLLTLPTAAAVGAAIYGVVRLFGDGVTGTVVVAALLLGALVAAGVRRMVAGRTLTAEG
jgi:inorganic phosphate transporter, PiT family